METIYHMQPNLSSEVMINDVSTISGDITRFGEKLRILRNHHGLTLAQTASILGYHTHSYLSEIESGRKIPTVSLVIKLSRLFGISTDELLFDEIIIYLEKSKLLLVK